MANKQPNTSSGKSTKKGQPTMQFVRKYKYVLLTVVALLAVALFVSADASIQLQEEPSTNGNQVFLPSVVQGEFPTPMPTAAPTHVEPSPDADGWKTYTDNVAGFSFKYPGDWFLSYNDGSDPRSKGGIFSHHATVTSYDSNTKDPSEWFVGNEVSVSISRYPVGEGYEDYEHELNQLLTNSDDFVVASGVSASYTNVTVEPGAGPGGSFGAYYLRSGDKVLHVNVLPVEKARMPVVQQIVSSIEFK
jgi:hypothetical protein